MNVIGKLLAAAAAVLGVAIAAAVAARAQDDQMLRIFISVDMEGIGGIGSPKMTAAGGKDYELGRDLLTEEVNAVVAAILEEGPAFITVNDSHGDHQNVRHERLHPDVVYVQGDKKPLGMVQELDSLYDGVIFIGYHARAGAHGFLAHTGSGAVRGLWLNGVEVGEGGLNAAYAGSRGAPVILAAGDLAFTEEISALFDTRTVVTKEAVTAQSAILIHPEKVRDELRAATREAIRDIRAAQAWNIGEPVDIRLEVSRPVRADVLESIPGVTRIDGDTVGYRAESMEEAYKLIRLMYKFIQP
ncbi:MAG: M55 family metallopeptidase [Parvularculaceae bacterium]